MFIGGYVYKSRLKRMMAGLFDLLGWLLFGIIRLLRGPFDPAAVKSIVIFRIDHLGDVVMTRPAIQALRNHFPEATIDLVVTDLYQPLCVRWPEVDNVIAFKANWFVKKAHWLVTFDQTWALASQMRRRHYDLGIDFRGDVRNIALLVWGAVRYRLGRGYTGGRFMLSAEGDPVTPPMHQMEQNTQLLQKIGIVEDAVVKPQTFTQTEKSAFWSSVASMLSETPSRPRFILHASSGNPDKRWSPEKFKELIQKISCELDAEIVLIGTASEKKTSAAFHDIKNVVDLRGKTQVEDLPILFEGAKLFMGNDSGPGHIAGTQDVESIVLFSGLNQPQEWQPRGNKLHVLEPASTVEVSDVWSIIENLMAREKV